MSTLAQKAEAFTLSAKSTEELIAESRRRIAARRAEREAESAIETGVGGFTMERRLAVADRRQAERRFTGAPLTGFGLFK